MAVAVAGVEEVAEWRVDCEATWTSWYLAAVAAEAAAHPRATRSSTAEAARAVPQEDALREFSLERRLAGLSVAVLRVAVRRVADRLRVPRGARAVLGPTPRRARHRHRGRLHGRSWAAVEAGLGVGPSRATARRPTIR